jgi:hypothetical protein
MFSFEVKYDKKDQQGKAAFNERNISTIQQQEPVARSPGGPKHEILRIPLKRSVLIGKKLISFQLTS